MHGRGLKFIFDTSLWASLNDESLLTADNVGDLSAQDLATPNGAAANDDALDEKRLIAKP